jgi:ATP-dependent RNA helicase TDRD9
MPKIRGLTSLLCLLFTPTCEVRLSPNRKYFTGALCGLGCDKNTKQPYYIDNDIECTFDTKIGFEEFKVINSVRMAINMVIGSEEDANKWTADPSLLRKLQQKACNKLLALIERERTPIEKKYFLKYGRWNQLKPEQIVDIVEPEYKFENYLYSNHSVALIDID